MIGSRLAEIVPFAARVELAGWTRYALLDRGSYEYIDDIHEPALFAALVARASQLTGTPLAVAEARALRLGPGDYILAHHDRVHADYPLELVLDLSPAAVPGAEVHYRRRGAVFFRAPCAPGTLAIVERGPAVTRNHTYVSKLHANARVVRIVLLLASLTSGA